MTGFTLVGVATDARGNVDLADLRGEALRADGGADAHEPLDARPLRRGDRGGDAARPRRRRALLLRRREPERRLRDLAAGRHGLRHRPLQPAQDVLAAARRRRPRRRPDRRPRRPRALSCPSRCSCGGDDGTLRPRRRPAASPSARCAASSGRSASSCAPTRTSAPTGPRPARDVRDRRPERELPARPAQGRLRAALRPPLHARVRALGAAAEARPRRSPRSTSRSA